MKRFLFGVVLAMAALAGFGSAAQAANTDNFTITNYEVRMELGRDSERRSTLKTTLTITADFPPNQNRGIAPIFVKDYDGHHTSFNLVSVTDETGAPLEYAWNEDELRIGNKNVYVEGKKTYVITYTQRDVTKHYADTAKDEFYWDAIGVEWRVPIEKASVSLVLSDDLQTAKQTDLQCYVGSSGSTDRCSTEENESGDMSVVVQQLIAGQGVTVAVGFAPGTFAEYKMTFWERLTDLWSRIQRFLVFPVVVSVLLLVLAYSRSVNRNGELKPIVPEYLPPKDVSLTISASILSTSTVFNGFSGMVRGSVITAQLLDLAVRHFIKIYEVKPKQLFRAAEYEVEIVKPISELKAEERELLDDMFGARPKVGDKLNLKTLKYSMTYKQRTMDNDARLARLMGETYGLKSPDEAHKRRFVGYAKVLGVLSVVLLSPMFAAATVLALVFSRGKRLTDKGLVIKRYLLGLEMYIGVAEEERLRMLQSPEGAEKVAVAGLDDVDDPNRIIKL